MLIPACIPGANGKPRVTEFRFIEASSIESFSRAIDGAAGDDWIETRTVSGDLHLVRASDLRRVFKSQLSRVRRAEREACR